MVATVSMNIGTEQITRVIGEIQTLTYSTHMDKAPVRSVGNINAKDYVYGPRTIAGSLVFAVFDQHFAYNTFISEYNKQNNVNTKIFNSIMDEMPPFDITVSFVNEFGHQSRLALYGVRIIDEGIVLSVNDVYTENTYQFVATDLDYMNKSNSLVSNNNKEPLTTTTKNKDSNVEKIKTVKETTVLPNKNTNSSSENKNKNRIEVVLNENNVLTLNRPGGNK